MSESDEHPPLRDMDGANEPGTTVPSHRGIRANLTLRRESDAMGLTAALALLVALSTGDDLAPHSKLDVLLAVWGTTIGLAIAHWFALLVATWLVSNPDITSGPLELLRSEAAMALVVAVVASVVVLVLPERFDRLGARVSAALFIAVLVAFETRRRGMSPLRRAALSGGVAVVGVGIAAIKWLIS